ncbi:cold and drought-regulated protein CORA-like [Drosophila rhopaloa]|uniref:Cold and drought-regulated protein CORA-like n=1 Tax=Drosophila rhopaloa TaxID=1041015 RepID=A0A6P4FWJ8_DRORH|nr:cold and drought-regulated protein CORA-like [Drosophila rhopaloa]
MRLILFAVVGLLCLTYALALKDNEANLKDLLDVAHHGGAHAESGVRQARGGNYGGYGGGGHGGGGHYGGGGRGGGGHYGGGHGGGHGGHGGHGGGRGGHY